MIVGQGAATRTTLGGGADDGGLADLLARKLSESCKGPVVVTLAARLTTLDDVRALVALADKALGGSNGGS